jgi:hypothetical protein
MPPSKPPHLPLPPGTSPNGVGPIVLPAWPTYSLLSVLPAWPACRLLSVPIGNGVSWRRRESAGSTLPSLPVFQDSKIVGFQTLLHHNRKGQQLSCVGVEFVEFFSVLNPLSAPYPYYNLLIYRTVPQRRLVSCEVNPIPCLVKYIEQFHYYATHLLYELYSYIRVQKIPLFSIVLP